MRGPDVSVLVLRIKAQLPAGMLQDHKKAIKIVSIWSKHHRVRETIARIAALRIPNFDHVRPLIGYSIVPHELGISNLVSLFPAHCSTINKILYPKNSVLIFLYLTFRNGNLPYYSSRTRACWVCATMLLYDSSRIHRAAFKSSRSILGKVNQDSMGDGID